jgi:hypothetical protein
VTLDLPLMFSSRVTRPLLWAIPLAVVGGIAAVPWFPRPLTVDIDGVPVRCGEIMVADTAIFDPCTDVARERLVGTGVILLVGGLPLALVALRACVMSADALVSIKGEPARRHERLDRLDSGR